MPGWPRTLSAGGARGRSGTLRRRLLIAAGVLLVVVAAAAGGGLLWLRTSVPAIDGRLAGLAGLTRPAAVTRDSRGVLYITAETATDASFALGFAHAQDRLWQMEMTRRIGTGRLAEVVGEAGLAADRMIRTLGLPRLAEANLERLSPEARAHVEAYSAGVNAYLDTRSGALPPEFVLLGHRPEPWRPADSLLWGRLMSLQLAGNWFGEILRARMLKAGLTPAELDTLWAEGTSRRAGVLPADTAAALDAVGAARLDALAAGLPDELAPRLASNLWALPGWRTPTGRPVLAGDPHLGLSDPNVWTLARIDAPGYRRVGAFVAGVPFLVLGHNGRVAWTMTTTHSDTQDLFVEKLAPGDPGRYLTPDGSAAFASRTEMVTAGDRRVALVVRSTRHGPVVSDAMESAGDAAPEGAVLALASPVLREDDTTAEALFRMGSAGSADEFVTALRGFQAPQQNVAFADAEGRIGMISAGLVPIRAGGDGFLPAEGWSGRHDWLGWVPFDELPRSSGQGGDIVNANERVWPDSRDASFGREGDAPFRANRIRQRLKSADGSLDSMARIQLDTVSGFARAVVPHLLRLTGGHAPDAAARKAIGLLRGWDGDMAAERPEPVVFAGWIATLHERLFADELGPLLPGYRRIRHETLGRILTGVGGSGPVAESRWCDDRRTSGIESCEDIVSGALSEALADLTRKLGPDIAAWRWGDAHQAVFEHRVWGHVPLVGDLLERRAATGGGDYTINRGSWTVGDDPAFRHGHGASLRVIYDLADLDRSRFVAALGPSGNPFSPFYDSWQDDWARGSSFTIPGEPDLVRSRLELIPSGQ